MKQQNIKSTVGIAVMACASLGLPNDAYAEGAFGCVGKPVVELEAYVEGEAYLSMPSRASGQDVGRAPRPR